VLQSMFFAVGDVLRVPVKMGLDCSGRKMTQLWPVGSVLGDGHEVLGAAKGVVQLLLERGVEFAPAGCKQEKHMKVARDKRASALKAWQQDRKNDVLLLSLLDLPLQTDVGDAACAIVCDCAKCTLRRQPDFAAQRSGLEEIYDAYNLRYGTAHYCIFLPKFYPELNPIERCWSRMKGHTRKYCDGKLESLERFMNEGLSEEILPLWLLRKYIRLITAYYIAYGEGKDVVTADSWIRKHRAHQGFAQKMDVRLEQLYFPNGREERDDDAEEPIAAEAEQREEQAEDPDAWEEQEDEWDAVVEWFAEPDSTFRL
jgi:hypothetical protein